MKNIRIVVFALLVLVGCAADAGREDLGDRSGRKIAGHSEGNGAAGAPVDADDDQGDTADAAADLDDEALGERGDAGAADVTDAGASAPDEPDQPQTDASVISADSDAAVDEIDTPDAGPVETEDAATPSDATTARCSLGAGIVRGCDDFTQQHFPTLSISWGFDPDWDGTTQVTTYGCDSDPIVACAHGALCAVFDSNTGETKEGTCL